MIEAKQVSCVIPYAGAEKYIGEAVESALAQDFREVIVVNDGFPPGQLAAIAKRPGVRILHQPQAVGCPNARNLGLKSCVTSHIVLLDHDDLLCDGYFPAISSWVSENQLRCAAANLRYIGEDSRRVGAVVSRHEDFFMPSGFFSELSLIAEIGYFLDTCADDLFFFRSIRQATRLTVCPQAGVLYRIHPQAGSSVNTRALWAFSRLVPLYDEGIFSLAEINRIARDYGSRGIIPAGLEMALQDDDSVAARFAARSAYASWLNRNPAGVLKYGAQLTRHLPMALRIVAKKWKKN